MQDKSISVDSWLRESAQKLHEVNIESARLDAEIILAHTLRKNRPWLHAHGNEMIAENRLEIAQARLALRCERIPIAYIIGHKEFYGRLFTVTPSVLIPRPESETMIDTLKHLPNIATKKTLIDVGAGSGCLGITAKLELPHLKVILADISAQALAVAKKNAARLHAGIATTSSNLLDNIPPHQDIIVANLPYVDMSWERSPETAHEPEIALFAKNGGLQLINQLIQQVNDVLTPAGYLLLEADPSQHANIIRLCREHGLLFVTKNGYILAFVRAKSDTQR